MFDTAAHTKKLYYQDQYMTSSSARIVGIDEGCIALDQTVLYPEGGGQESDTGLLETPFGTLHIMAAKLLHGAPIHLDGFNGGKSGGVIVHRVAPQDQAMLANLMPGTAVTVHLNTERRQKLTLSHSASHFLYAAAVALRPELKENTIGCHIKEDGARFDFIASDPFVPDDIQAIERHANAMIARAQPITIEAHPDNADARTWIYEDIRIPCGGTHLASPQDIGCIRVTRKKLGKNKERLMCAFEGARISIDKYHETEL